MRQAPHYEGYTNPHTIRRMFSGLICFAYGSLTLLTWQFQVARVGTSGTRHVERNSVFAGHRLTDLPSGKHTKNYRKWPIEIVDLPIKNGDFP